jgi:hypothetical protein
MKYKVGDMVCVVIDTKLYDVTITKIGRKYLHFSHPEHNDWERWYRINKQGIVRDTNDKYSVGRLIPSKEDYLSTIRVLKKAEELYRLLMGYSVYTDNLSKMTIEEHVKLIEKMDHIIKVFTKEKPNEILNRK